MWCQLDIILHQKTEKLLHCLSKFACKQYFHLPPSWKTAKSYSLFIALQQIFLLFCLIAADVKQRRCWKARLWQYLLWLWPPLQSPACTATHARQQRQAQSEPPAPGASLRCLGFSIWDFLSTPPFRNILHSFHPFFQTLVQVWIRLQI